jgi:hypothetical protein
MLNDGKSKGVIKSPMNKETTNKPANKETTNKPANKESMNKPANKESMNKANKESMNKPANKETTNKETDSFFQVNTTISKFVFILLILILFVMFFHLGLFFLEYIYGSTRSPYIINGLIDSDKSVVISSNPNVDKSIPIMRSVNELTGIEYTWSLWLYIEEPFLNSGNQYKRIFSKGTYTMYDTLDNHNVSFINNSPGLYYGEQDNKLILVFNTYSNDSDVYETIDIDDIPIEKWISCSITLKDKKVNVYINGVMSKEYILLNVPKQNYYDTTVGDNKGFGGYISNLRYYDYAITEENIQTIMTNGPNLTRDKNNKIYDNPPWLSMNWYYN